MNERAVLFGASGTLVGVVTSPEAAADGPAFVMLNAGLLHRIGPHRLYVELANALASLGLASIRFDFSGIGDSGARADQLPARLAAVEETRDAMGVLEATVGSRRFVVVGLCSGADAAFRTAARDPRVVGAVLIDGPPYRSWQFFVRHYARRLLRPSSWRNALSGRHPVWNLLRARGAGGAASNRRVPDRAGGGLWPMPADRDIPPRREARDALRGLIERKVKICLVYTGGYGQFVNGAGQFGEVFPDLDARGCVQVERMADTDHTFTLRPHREGLIALLQSWCANAGWLAAAPPRTTDRLPLAITPGLDA